MATIKDNAICIRQVDWSETSQVVVLMSEHHGKISATAKGAKRLTPSTMAKFSGGVELLCRGEAVLILKPTTELANLIEWDLRDAHWGLRRNLRAFEWAMYAGDVVNHLVQDHDAHPATYVALRHCLADLAAGSGNDEDDTHAPKPQTTAMQHALLCFQWAVLVDSGHRPVLDRDAQTGESLDAGHATLAFSSEYGGVVADTGATDRWRTRRPTIELLQQLSRSPQPTSINPTNSVDADEALMRANRLLCAYLRAILDKQLPTMAAVLGK